MCVNWTNPYADRDNHWRKGNLHAHSSPGSGCAGISLADLITAYENLGYTFLSVSDHMHLTLPEEGNLILLPGLEWNVRDHRVPDSIVARRHHVGVHSSDIVWLEQCPAAREPEELFELTEKAIDSPLLILNHPNWLIPEHYNLHELETCGPMADGLEIYNALIEGLEGEADATGKWDRLLTNGSRLLGFASDDAHLKSNIGRAWIMVRAGRDRNSILENIKSGNFYCSTGVVILDIGRNDATLFLTLEGEARVRVIGSGGRVLDTMVCREFECGMNQFETTYIRFHIQDRNWGQAWSQPFFKTLNGAEV
jgi:hypothetical protein